MRSTRWMVAFAVGILALYQHEQLSRHGKSKQNANVSRCEQIPIFASFMMLRTEEVGRVNQLPLTSEVET
jgi:hypothetical protein